MLDQPALGCVGHEAGIIFEIIDYCVNSAAGRVDLAHRPEFFQWRTGMRPGVDGNALGLRRQFPALVGID